MTKTVMVKHDYAPPDTEYEVPGFGIFKNGVAREVTDVQVEVWELTTGQKFPENGKLELPLPTRPPPVEAVESEAEAVVVVSTPPKDEKKKEGGEGES